MRIVSLRLPGPLAAKLILQCSQLPFYRGRTGRKATMQLTTSVRKRFASARRFLPCSCFTSLAAHRCIPSQPVRYGHRCERLLIVAQPKLYNPRHPQRTLLYQTIAQHYESWLELVCAGQFDGQGDHHTPRPYVRKAFAKYLQCGIFAHGFARARCDDCGHDYFVAFSCKGRGVCPSCNTRRMVQTAAHLTDHVFPRLAVRQWVLSVPKRLRYCMQRDGVVLNVVLRIFLRVIAQSLSASSSGAGSADTAALWPSYTVSAPA
jgi:Transposase zinc-binding domain